MYAVVGCGACQALWIVEGQPETSQCPRCGKRRSYEKRREFVTTPDENHAREVRSSMLAARQGLDDAFAQLDSFAKLETQLEDAGIDEETYLEQSGIDPDAVTPADDRQTGSQSNREIITDALRTLDAPTESAVVAYASERNVEPSVTRRVLDKLHRAGEITENDGVYRLV